MPRPDWPLGSGLEEYLSVTWVDHFTGDLEQRLTAVTATMKDRLRKSFHDERSRIGVLLVDAVHSAARLNSKHLNVRVVNPATDASYTGIYGMDLDDEIIAQELARQALLFRPRVGQHLSQVGPVANTDEGENASLLDREQAIRERAYFIWEAEGRPDGNSLAHWLQAEAEIRVIE
jgi:hypothetical protein